MVTNLISKSVVEQIDYSRLLLRIVAMVLLAFSVSYWAILVGFSNETMRFDVMPNSWKIAGTSLVVLQPVAALGLWGGWRWGVVLWILVSLIEFAMYGVYQDIFGSANYVLIFHAAGLLLYFAMIVILSRVKKPVTDSD